MGESTANALASTSAPKNAMNRNYGRARFHQENRCQRLVASAGTAVQDQNPPSAGLEVTSAAIASSSASLRSVRTEMLKFPLRGGNDAPWKTPKASFPPRLEIRQKAPDSHIPTASTAASISLFPKLYRAPPHRIL
jgi:hypothetical protein